MRVLYIDIDSLRPDHLGCYGYHRDTSPNIDRLAAESVRFTNVYVSDAPCLPSRTALWSGRTGFHNGVVNHGGVAAQPFMQGPDVGDRANVFSRTGWMRALADLGMTTATVSPFGQRHAAWHWYAGFNHIHNTGKYGDEIAADIVPVALDWLDRHGAQDNWFLHVNLWDPHTPFRTPAAFGEPFAGQPLPAWFTAEMWQRAWDGFGPHSPREPNWFFGPLEARFPRQPDQIDSLDAVRRWVDGYDTGIRYADEWIGRLIARLQALRVYDDTIVVVSADHGENIGELNVWGDHQTADHITCRVPLLIRFPGVGGAPRVDTALHYHFDWAATLIELLGGAVPHNWDGVSFAPAFRRGAQAGRDCLVTSQGAWACQRGVRFAHDGADYLALRTYHDGLKELAPRMLFNLTADYHLQHDLASAEPHVLDRAMSLLESWYAAQMTRSESDVDPLMTVLREGGPFYTRGYEARYIERLKATGRAQHARRLAKIHHREQP
ncbi:MAG: sulfatase-like hydrolase/transferase [Anaerolineales bacterium]|nr:sulfatase-like hydrolase/transferase [Anaerolineales bacterium]